GRPQSSPPNVAGVARERRVLLIDDDLDLANLYLLQLRRDGIPLEHTPTGQEADTFVRTRVPAPILVDLRLPDVDGRALTERWADESVAASNAPTWGRSR